MDFVEVKRLIRDIVGAVPNLPIQAIVTKVDDFTISAKIGDLEIDNILLKTQVENNDNFMVQRPKIGSPVTLLSVDGTLNSLQVVKINEVEEFEYHHNGLTIKLDGKDGKLIVKNNEVNLYQLMTDLATIVKQLKVYTAVGPSGTPLPDTIARVELFEKDFKQLLKPS
ncbi:hypothetical protein [Empedobacter sp. GD03797]|uniref:hypothetical protein n=1 Tax=Empedobacter sp. GD03797 TaxID=2975382 RepID=UPI002446C27B|nr:hypothetical protein [Empedobacter sp. GD03797]MDH1880926.1 hypothetical protein [Empedobacter sp. GD03797]